MKIGELRHRIEIQEYVYTSNEIGEYTKSWKKHSSIWAKKERLKAMTTSNQGKEEIIYNYRFTIRSNKNINETMRILYDGIIYNIDHINHITSLNSYATLDCSVIKEGVYNE